MQYCLWVNLIYGCTTTNLIYMTHIGPSTLNRCLNPIYSTMLTGTMSFTVKLPVEFVILLCLFSFCCMVCCKNCRYVVCALGCAGHPAVSTSLSVLLFWGLGCFLSLCQPNSQLFSSLLAFRMTSIDCILTVSHVCIDEKLIIIFFHFIDRL